VHRSTPTRLPLRTVASFATFAFAVSLQAHALTRVTLRNGFTYDCTTAQPLDPTHTRLLLTANSYIDLATNAIASVETLPDPAPAPATPAPTPTPTPAAIPELLAHAGTQHNIDVDLLAAVVKAESGFHPHAVSRAGARGLMQLMPATAQDLGVADAFQPDQNIAGGTAYLDALLKKYDPLGDKHGLDLALAAYNAGPAAVDRYHGIPPYRETRAYVARVENEFIRRKAAATKADSATTSLASR
jgi:soluble lytic murein transglycosylase-like protein